MGRGRKQLPEPPAGARRQWAADRALRPPMRSPGRPEPSRAVQREFWRLIASGVTTVEAAEGVGVSWPVGARWFRHAGGMPPLSLDEPTGRYLSFAEREEIALLRAQDAGVREIARRIGRDPGTISRELRRNAATRSGKQVYRAVVAQWKAQQAAKRPKTAKLAGNGRLREYVQERLAGSVRRPDGTAVTGPRTPAWKGLNKPHRQDRRWATAWSPEQISHRLKVDFPDDESMRISHEAIYQSLFIEGRGALKRELVACLRTGRALREPRARSRNKPQGHVTADVVLSERPAEAADRAVPGHWEGDLIIGTGRSAIGTLVERSSRSTLLVHLPRLEGWGEKPPVKNGPSLGGYGAVAMNTALTGVDDEAARAAAQDPHLGPREGTLRPCAVRARHRNKGVLRRSALALAAADKREHERAAAPVLPEGHRPVPVVGRGPRSRRPRDQQPAPQDPRLEDPRRGLRRAATLTSTTRCCIDRLNSPSTPRSTSPPWPRPNGVVLSVRPEGRVLGQRRRRELLRHHSNASSSATAPGPPGPARTGRSSTTSRAGTTPPAAQHPGLPQPRRIRITAPQRRPKRGMINTGNLSVKADQAHPAPRRRSPACRQSGRASSKPLTHFFVYF